MDSRTPPTEITNCHIHTFTHEHAPSRFVRPPLNYLLRIGPFRRWLLGVVQLFDRGRRGRIARYAEILEISHNEQKRIFEIVQAFYPPRTRFVVLPMDMELMGAGRVKKAIERQHDELTALRDSFPEQVIPFAAVDPRREGVVETTVDLLERRGFRGLKLYPPLGYHPNDRALWPLYAYAEEHGVPVLTHCSRPAGVQYRGKVTERMRTDPLTGKLLDLDRKKLLTLYTDPYTYRPILEKHPSLRLCLAHFGGAGDWSLFLKRPWSLAGKQPEKGWLAKASEWVLSGGEPDDNSWLAKILGMIASGEYPNLWTDIAYTLFADDEYLYLLKVLLADDLVRSRVLFGSDFYVVADATLEERRRSIRLRAVLGEDLFRRIAQDNPREFLGAI